MLELRSSLSMASTTDNLTTGTDPDENGWMMIVEEDVGPIAPYLVVW
jgi:hypothetical protein